MTFIVGAYAAMPADPAEAITFLDLLAEADWVDGLEIPYPGGERTRLADIADHPAVGTFSTLTLIPGTMGNLAGNPTFGLASPDPEGRAAALAWCRAAIAEVGRVHETVGRKVIARIQIHSAPTRFATPDAFEASLAELSALDLAGARLVIEHCDAWTEDFPAEKGFLTLDEELDLAQAAGIGVHLNWGRSVKEARDPQQAIDGIVAAGRAGLLEGLMFSGIATADTAFGPAWGDTHAPLVDIEPSSLLTIDAITACTAAAGEIDYLGAKVQLPAEYTAQQRIEALRTIARAAGIA